jgi:hypothetical protein
LLIAGGLRSGIGATEKAELPEKGRYTSNKRTYEGIVPSLELVFRAVSPIPLASFRNHVLTSVNVAHLEGVAPPVVGVEA